MEGQQKSIGRRGVFRIGEGVRERFSNWQVRVEIACIV